MIDLSASKVLCTFHPLPWKETWGEAKTYVAVTKFTMRLFDVLVRDESFIEACDGGKTELIDQNLPIPLCCWVAKNYPDELYAAYLSLDVESPNAGEIARPN
jgi:hypothetical protein